MNIFYLHPEPRVCAQMHVDKHCVKMILEYSQLLSTAHRLLDGVESVGVSPSGRKKKVWTLPDHRNDILYSATHINHPSAIWARESRNNYIWLSQLLTELCDEYTHRYGKVHKCQATSLLSTLQQPPVNIADHEFTEPTPAMPVEFKVDGDSVQSYKNYYLGAKTRMFSWRNRQVPDFVK